MSDIKLVLQYTKNLSVLYVEDDDTLREINAGLFQKYFKNVITAQNGKEGLEKYIEYEKQHSQYFDIVISDIQMPQLDGLGMSKEILHIHNLQNIILTTAYNDIDTLCDAFELGISAFLAKPLEGNKLNNALYRASLAVSDRKFVEEHVEMIENLNMQLEEQNTQLLHKNEELEKSFRMLDTTLNKQKMQRKNPQSFQRKTKVTKKSDVEKEFLEQIGYLVSDDLYELQEILDEIDKDVIELISNSEFIEQSSLNELIDNFSKYTSILQMYSFFTKLSSAMSSFAITMQEQPLPQNKETIKNVFMLLESFIYVLGNWHKDISSNDSSKINQFDASIISDVETITNMWTQKEEEFDEEDLDDIFDF